MYSNLGRPGRVNTHVRQYVPVHVPVAGRSFFEPESFAMHAEYERE
jgi:hypothetical protein